VNAEKTFYESYGINNWLVQGLLLAAGIAAPLLCSGALMSGRALPTFLELWAPRRQTPIVADVDAGGTRRDDLSPKLRWAAFDRVGAIFPSPA
jgi:hypothetical protein